MDQIGQQSPTINIQGQPPIPTPGTGFQIDSFDNDSLTGRMPDLNSMQRQWLYAQRAMMLSKPEPPTEFQQFVTASTGQTLPIYGRDLFTTMPVSFGPLDQAPAPREMIVGTDDELRVRAWGQINFSANLRVSREGEIFLPKIGAVHVAGLPFSDVAAHLRSRMERVYRNFDLSVDMGEIHSIQIYVTGLARQPGEFTVSALSTMVDAVFLSGGPAAAGSMRHVQLKRGGKVITDFDLYALLVQGDKTGDVQLQSGDVLYIPPAGAQVAVLGSVRQAAIYELRGKQTLDDLLSAAGGRTTIASGARISLERIDERAGRRAFDISADAGLSTPLADGDIVRIDSIISNYRATVTLRGAVANPGHFGWRQGMRLSDVIPDRDSLLSRDYWWRRTQLGLPASEFTTPLTPVDTPADSGQSSMGAYPAPAASPAGIQNGIPASPYTLSAAAPRNQAPGQAITLKEAEIAAERKKPEALTSPQFQTNWNYAVIERMSPETMKTSLIPFSLGKLVLEHDSSQDLPLMPGDVITIFNQADIQIPVNEQTKYVTLEGEFVHPGVYSVAPDETLQSVVARAGGLTPQAYLYAARYTRKSTQELEKQNMNEFADELEHQLMRNSLTPISVNAATTAASGETFQVSRELIAHIRNTHATGRIVLNLHANESGDYVLPDMHLEDGDRLYVPFKPDTVQVLGEVYNPHAFIYHPGASVGQLLGVAGGPKRDADSKRMFILRADGTVVSRDSTASMFGNKFNELKLHPGDSVVVPEKNVHLSTTAQVLAWTQAVSQAALPAALAATAATR
jgi:protein involved in polysaccharide export with SLBB domain